MVNLNGILQEGPSAILDLDNRGLNYGDAVFETLCFRQGKILFWEDHYFRLMASMRILRMEIPLNFTMEFLESEILKSIDVTSNDKRSYRVKLLIWRKAGGKYTPEYRDIEYAISVAPLNASSYKLNASFCEIELFKDHFVSSGLLSTLKSNNRLINVLGSIYADENGYDNCLLLNENKQVVEALNGNIFLVAGKSVKTPPLSDGCLNGILRKQLIRILQASSEYNFEEASISPFELQKADELFITNVIGGIISVTKYRKREYGNQLATRLVPKLNLQAVMAN